MNKKDEFKKVDLPFLEKFNQSSVYIDSYGGLCQSIVEEIGNILFSKLKLSGKYGDFKDIPFSYGVRDIQSVNASFEELRNFKTHCEEAILNLEPRLESIEISDIKLDKEKQVLNLKIICLPKHHKQNFITEIKLQN